MLVLSYILHNVNSLQGKPEIIFIDFIVIYAIIIKIRSL